MPESCVLEPRTAALAESLRSFGYSFGDAIADLIDNSVSAGAKNVDVDVDISGTPYIRVVDDGRGMDEPTLKNALRPGSGNPRDARRADDLGRFGLGLKTASFSQARKLTVISRQQGRLSPIVGWDLDHLQAAQAWEALIWRPEEDEVAPHVARLGEGNGTVVVWQNVDRIFVRGSGDRMRRRVLEHMDQLRLHLGLVFGPLLKQESLKITVAGAAVEAIDPFLSAHIATKNFGAQRLPLSNKSRVTVTPYVLPYRSSLTDEEFEQAGRPGGWAAQQGFYVYRCGRLLVGGNWLGLRLTRDVPYNLARIRIDIGNDADDEWQIDVRKSRAHPPDEIRDELKRIAKITRERSAETYRRRGQTRERIQGEAQLLWHRAQAANGFRFVLNRAHPTLQAFAGALEPQRRRQWESLLAIIEKAVPTRAIVIAATERDDALPAPFESEPIEEVAALALEWLKLLVGQGQSIADAAASLRFIEPFSERTEAVDIAERQLRGET